MPAGEDEFVELDEEGQPRRKSAARGPRKASNVRRKVPTARARVPAAVAPAETASAAESARAAPEAVPVAEAAAPAAADAVEPADLADDEAIVDEAIIGVLPEEGRSKPAVRRKPGSRKSDKNGE